MVDFRIYLLCVYHCRICVLRYSDLRKKGHFLIHQATLLRDHFSNKLMNAAIFCLTAMLQSRKMVIMVFWACLLITFDIFFYLFLATDAVYSGGGYTSQIISRSVHKKQNLIQDTLASFICLSPYHKIFFLNHRRFFFHQIQRIKLAKL